MRDAGGLRGAHQSRRKAAGAVKRKEENGMANNILDIYACGGLNAMAAECNRIAREHGWWDNPPSFGEIIALCHSELSEALEEHRDGMPPAYVMRKGADGAAHMETDMGAWAPEDKPEGAAVEMADCLIRLLDWFGAMGYDVEAIVRAKCAYNETRPYRHGGKRL